MQKGCQVNNLSLSFIWLKTEPLISIVNYETFLSHGLTSCHLDFLLNSYT